LKPSKPRKTESKPKPQAVSPVALLERERRQLDRYLFKFSRGRSGVSGPTSAFKLSRQQLTRSGVMNDWSIKDVLAWLVSWERGLLAWLRAPSRRPPATGEKNDQDLLDPETFRRLRRRALDEVVAESQESFQNVMRTLRDHSGVVSDIVALNLVSRYSRARTHIRDWLKAQRLQPSSPAPAPLQTRKSKHRPRK
jgi:hypothetical protein